MTWRARPGGAFRVADEAETKGGAVDWSSARRGAMLELKGTIIGPLKTR